MFERLRSFFVEKKAAGSIDSLLSALGGSPTSSGISINVDSALRVPVVFGALRVIAESVGQLPVHAYHRTAAGGRERASDHRVEALLTTPNDWTDGALLRTDMTLSLAAYGEAFAFVNRGADGCPVEMIRLDHGSVSVETDRLTMEPAYHLIDANGSRRPVDRRDILHVRSMGLRGHTPLRPIMEAREAIGLAAVLEAYAAGLFGRGCRPAGVLKIPGKLGDAPQQRLRVSLTQNYAGAGNAGKLLLLEDGVTFEPHQLTSADSQFLEMRRFQLQEIARVWRVPLHLLGDLERTTHNNAESMGQAFLTFTLLPYLKLWQGALNRMLFTPEERRSYYIEFNVDDLARADLGVRMQAYATAISHGIYNPNEVRGMENRDGYQGGEVYTRPLNAGPMEGINHANP